MTEEARSDPFAMTADPAAYVPRPASERALHALAAAFEASAPVVVLSGPAGLGKTLLLRLLEARLHGRRSLVVLPYAALPAADVCRWALSVLGRPAGGDPPAALDALAHDFAARGAPLVLVLDDGSTIPLDTARTLASLAGESRGALSLLVALTDDAKSETVAAALGGSARSIRFEEPLTAPETAAYVAARLARVGAADDLRRRFDPVLLDRLHRASRGVPRVVHRLASEVVRRGAVALLDIELDEPALEPERSPRRVETPPPTPAAARVAVLEAERAQPLATQETPQPIAPEPEAPPRAPASAPVPQPPQPPPPTPAPQAPPPTPAPQPAAPPTPPRVEAPLPIAKAPEPPKPPPSAPQSPSKPPTAAPAEPRPAAPPAPPKPEPAPPRAKQEASPQPTAPGASPNAARGWGRAVRILLVALAFVGAGIAVPLLLGRDADRKMPRVQQPEPSLEPTPPERPRAAEARAPEPPAPPAPPAESQPAPTPPPAPPEPQAPAPPPPQIEEPAPQEPAAVLEPPPAEPPPTEMPPATAPMGMQPPPELPSTPTQAPAATAPAPEPATTPAPTPSAPPAPETAPVPLREAPKAEAAAPVSPQAPPPQEAPRAKAEPPPPPPETKPAPSPSAAPAPPPEPSEPPPPPAAPPVSVAINATPWATIEIDGRDVGETPLAGVMLAPGAHVFRARMPDGRVVERSVEIDAGNRFVSFR